MGFAKELWLQKRFIFKEIHRKDFDKYFRVQVFDNFGLSNHNTELGGNF